MMITGLKHQVSQTAIAKKKNKRLVCVTRIRLFQFDNREIGHVDLNYEDMVR